MTVCKQGEDVHTAILPQMICDEFMGGYDFEKHLEHLRAIYRHKAGLMLSLIDRHLVPAASSSARKSFDADFPSRPQESRP